MKTRIFFCIALFLSVNVSAEDNMKYMLKPEPDWLGYSVVNGDDCPTTKSEVEKAVEGVFVRARIEPAKNVSRVIDAEWKKYGAGANDKIEEVIYLGVILNCTKANTNIFINPVFNLSLYFSKWIEDADGDFHVKFGKDYGTSGVGTREYILDAIKNRTENALTDYIKVNFIDNKTYELTQKDLLKKLTD